MARYEPHPLALLFPPMSDLEYAALKQDIQENGLRDPVDLYEKKILDGRHRARACYEVGAELRTQEYEGDDPVGFVISKNIRRNLTQSQKAMSAARVAQLPRGRPGKNRGNAPHIPTTPQAAGIFGVSEDIVKDAKQILRDAAPEIIKQVDSGALTVAAAVIHLREEEWWKRQRSKPSYIESLRQRDPEAAARLEKETSESLKRQHEEARERSLKRQAKREKQYKAWGFRPPWESFPGARDASTHSYYTNRLFKSAKYLLEMKHVPPKEAAWVKAVCKSLLKFLDSRSK